METLAKELPKLLTKLLKNDTDNCTLTIELEDGNACEVYIEFKPIKR